MCLRDKVSLIDVLVIPELPNALILGTDFWSNMGIVPDLRRGEWQFSKPSSVADSICHIKAQTELSWDESQILSKTTDELFSQMGYKLGCTHLVEHVITTDAPAVKQRYYPVSPVMQQHIDRELEVMLKEGIIEKSNSDWSSPILLLKKKDGNYRFCVDYRQLNKVTRREAYPLPYVSNTLDKLRDAKYLSSLDIKSAYWQVPVAESSRPYTAFTVPNRGLFQFRRMPFGLHNDPATWQRLVDRVIGADLEPHVFVYLDDIIIVTQTFEDHLRILKEVFKRLASAGLTLPKDKCQFCRPELRYLGYVVDRNGLHVDPEKVTAILNIPTPKNDSEVRRILGMAAWYRRFVSNFSSVIAPLTVLLRKNKSFVWDSACEQAFAKIKEHLVSAPVLKCPDYSLPFTVQTDASQFGL